MEISEEYIRKVSTKGQITIPVEVRRLLGVKPHDKVVFVVKGGRVQLRRVAMTLKDTFGSVPPLKHSLSSEEMHDILSEERAQRWARAQYGINSCIVGPL